MVDVKEKVFEALSAIEGVTAFFYYPDTFVKLPCISYYEIHNGIFENADDTEYASEIVYVVDVWGDSSPAVTDIALEVNAAMSDVGFRREFSYDMHDANSNVEHKTMRFKLIV